MRLAVSGVSGIVDQGAFQRRGGPPPAGDQPQAVASRLAITKAPPPGAGQLLEWTPVETLCPPALGRSPSEVEGLGRAARSRALRRGEGGRRVGFEGFAEGLAVAKSALCRGRRSAEAQKVSLLTFQGTGAGSDLAPVPA
ncbi:hypothetical protein [Actinomadura mexicana]|uniref:hypothetical protein n=1 Tax=Actinomadura mexicana TaxID=134959 RepID=UPI001177E033|nr:hypothetical protein [Actinomadura mexicana]